MDIAPQQSNGGRWSSTVPQSQPYNDSSSHLQGGGGAGGELIRIVLFFDNNDPQQGYWAQARSGEVRRVSICIFLFGETEGEEGRKKGGRRKGVM